MDADHGGVGAHAAGQRRQQRRGRAPEGRLVAHVTQPAPETSQEYGFERQRIQQPKKNKLLQDVV